MCKEPGIEPCCRNETLKQVCCACRQRLVPRRVLLVGRGEGFQGRGGGRVGAECLGVPAGRAAGGGEVQPHQGVRTGTSTYRSTYLRTYLGYLPI